MLDNEQEAGAALRRLAEDPPPPRRTSVEDVVRLGRRRVRAQRVGSLAAVVAMVALVGVGAILLRSLAVGEPDQPPVATPAVSPDLVPLPGWTPLPVSPTCDPPVQLDTGAAIPPKEVVEPVFVSSVAAATGNQVDLVTSQWDPVRPRGYVEVGVPVGDGTGTVTLELGSYNGTPTHFADALLGAYGYCAPAQRLTLASGVVFQLHAPDTRSPAVPTQRLQVLTPAGRSYLVTSGGWSRQDIQPVAGDPGGIIEGGRGQLPVDQWRLADIGRRLAALN